MLRFTLILLTGLVWGLMGCRPNVPLGATGITREYDKPIPQAPPVGMVRIVPQKVQADGKTVHWKWTIVGDRNWAGTRQAGEVIELTDAYPLDATDRVGGTNAYECELVITADSGDGNTNLSHTISLKTIGVKLSGAVAGSVGTGGGVSGGSQQDVKTVAVDAATRVLLTDEQTLRLPLDQPLLELTGERHDGTVFRQVFSLKAAK